MGYRGVRVDNHASFDSIEHHVRTHRETSDFRGQVWAKAADMWVLGERQEKLSDGVGYAVRHIATTTVRKEVRPNLVEVRFCFRRKTIWH
jgi:hypothetical protein